MSKPFVVIVEDDASLGELFAATLEFIGFDTEVVRDSREAIARISARKPDLVTLDMQMPYVSGLDIIRQIRADENLAQLKVMMVTANARVSQQDELESLADVILIKPVTFSQIEEFAARLTHSRNGS